MKIKSYRPFFQNKKILFGTGIVVFIVLVSLFADFIAPFSPSFTEIENRLCKPSSAHIFGCDLHGGDIFTSILYGGRLSLAIAFLTVFFSLSIGVLLGLVSGFYGGKIDQGIMRLVDVTMAFPGILLALALLVVVGPSFLTIVITLVLTGWTAPARITRGEVLSLKSREYVQAATLIGVHPLKIMLHHILPGTISPLIVHSTFSISGVIIVESSLSFLGLGPQGVPTWGALLSDGKSVLSSAPYLSIAPGIAIMLTVVGLNFLGDGLRDFLDPKLSP